jgi:Pyruvate/2-oxoacid:ferredoxin oxidoreductase delta subunit
MKLCEWFGHNYKPYETLWVEFLPDKNTPFNREGVYRLKTVYCKRCGIIKNVIRDGSKLSYV